MARGKETFAFTGVKKKNWSRQRIGSFENWVCKLGNFMEEGAWKGHTRTTTTPNIRKQPEDDIENEIEKDKENLHQTTGNTQEELFGSGIALFCICVCI